MLGFLVLKFPHGRMSGTEKSWLIRTNRIYFFASEENECTFPRRTLFTHSAAQALPLRGLNHFYPHVLTVFCELHTHEHANKCCRGWTSGMLPET